MKLRGGFSLRGAKQAALHPSLEGMRTEFRRRQIRRDVGETAMKKLRSGSASGRALRQARAVTSERTLERLAGYPDEVLISVCRRFLSGKMNADQVAEVVTSEYPGFPVTRQQVFSMMRVAVQKGWLRLTPPVNEALQLALSSKFDKGAGSICVAAEEPGLSPTDQVANQGACLALQAIEEAAASQKELHIGLGGGTTMYAVCQVLARELRARNGLPRITFHSLTSGFNAFHPQYSPNGLLNLFAGLPKVGFEAILAPPLLDPKDYNRAIRNWEGLRTAFLHRREMDLILSSVGSAADPHDQLRRALQHLTPKSLRRLDREMLGDLLYLPYGEQGPLPADPSSLRTVTLFQLEDLRGFVQDREVGKKCPLIFLFASPCSICGCSKSRALRPLLRDNLKVWSKLVIDTSTAKELMSL